LQTVFLHYGPHPARTLPPPMTPVVALTTFHPHPAISWRPTPSLFGYGTAVSSNNTRVFVGTKVVNTSLGYGLLPPCLPYCGSLSAILNFGLGCDLLSGRILTSVFYFIFPW